METNSENPKSDISKASEDITSGVKALAKEMTKPEQLGDGKTEVLEEPIKDSFGEFKGKKEFFIGCDVGTTLEEKGGVVLVRSNEGEDYTRLVEIGTTPEAYDPSKGGQLIENAGNSGKYLMGVKTINNQTNEQEYAFRYLDEDEISGAEVKKGEQAWLNGSQNRQRQISVRGNVSSVVSLY